MTLLLTRSDVTTLLDLDRALELITTGFTSPAADVPGQRVRTDLPGPGTATALIPGLLPGIPAFTAKVNAKFPHATPALRGVICLHSLQTGELLALLDSASVTAWRTGLAAAVATHTLARPDASSIGFVGAGAQAQMTWTALSHLRPWTTVVSTDTDPARSIGDPLPTAAAVADTADVVVLATWSREPIIDTGRPGQHFTTLGADEPGKIELSRRLLETSRVIVDDPVLVAAAGALGNVGLDATAAAGTLSDVLRGSIPAHIDGGVSVYAPIGLPWQDLALSWSLYQRALDTGAGLRIDLLA
ncbi:ornithine cyclodeaminase [Kibdelosporangium banguiense]|uniref:Ornithine cyclodeaminase n=1 Tax=Kibdelosporangium banguiense TaxID=1365924 RepID=A0ABS4TSU0_9PSEU|nr:ornithine cyclodeaminase family protein [Kibdelosporangium banguiense]MBP2327466.1 ornithine cyclodeaminase [Kibdelosporangium banguiense]